MPDDGIAGCASGVLGRGDGCDSCLVLWARTAQAAARRFVVPPLAGRARM
jgi:hypothetical protein